MNILVTGALGQLGTEIRAAVKALGPSEDHYIFSDVASVPGEDILCLDITNSDAVRIVCASEKVDVIVNCAAYTDVEKAESDLDFADLINHRAVANLAKVAAAKGATLIHISTDYVFDGVALLSREDGEQRRFSRTILGNQSHPLTLSNRE